MEKKRFFLLTVVFLALLCGCARRQVVRPPDIMPQLEERPAKEEVVVLEPEEPIEEPPSILEAETVFEIVLGEKIEKRVAPPIKEEEKLVEKKEEEREALPRAVEPKIEPPVKERVKILNPKDVLRPGEELLFGIRYLGMRVGIGVLKIEEITLIQNRASYHLVSTARSTGIFAILYRVNERLDSFMDSTGLYSLRFEQHSYGKNPSSRITIYDQKSHLAYYEDKEIKIPSNVHDPISAFYHLRLHRLKVGEEVVININTGRENSRIVARVVGNEKIRTPAGEFDCLVVEPYLKGKDDPEERTLRVYITNDTRKIPVLITSKLPFGQVVLALEEIRG